MSNIIKLWVYKYDKGIKQKDRKALEHSSGFKNGYICICNLKKKKKQQQGMAGNTNPLTQDYLVWVKTELGNFMTYNSHVNEEKKKQPMTLM